MDRAQLLNLANELESRRPKSYSLRRTAMTNAAMTLRQLAGGEEVEPSKIPIDDAIADGETLYLLYWRGGKTPVLGVVLPRVSRPGKKFGSSSMAHGVEFTHCIKVPL